MLNDFLTFVGILFITVLLVSLLWNAIENEHENNPEFQQRMEQLQRETMQSVILRMSY